MIAIDTGYFLALLNERDAYHQRAQDWLSSSSEGWITTWPVVTETSYMIGRLGETVRHDFIADLVSGEIVIWDIPSEAARKIPVLTQKFAKLPMDLADASLVLLAEHLGHGRILTTDQRDFGAYRWKSTKPFVNLMAQT
ncbi:MAG: PIN domain-containing protein [Brachymonas sp.]|nr:PIN domain-containing protein [Brachymonas sp.]